VIRTVETELLLGFLPRRDVAPANAHSPTFNLLNYINCATYIEELCIVFVNTPRYNRQSYISVHFGQLVANMNSAAAIEETVIYNPGQGTPKEAGRCSVRTPNASEELI
jgi:hypothetical protein